MRRRGSERGCVPSIRRPGRPASAAGTRWPSGDRTRDRVSFPFLCASLHQFVPDHDQEDPGPEHQEEGDHRHMPVGDLGRGDQPHQPDHRRGEEAEGLVDRITLVPPETHHENQPLSDKQQPDEFHHFMKNGESKLHLRSIPYETTRRQRPDILKNKSYVASQQKLFLHSSSIKVRPTGSYGIRQRPDTQVSEFGSYVAMQNSNSKV
ncbi:hypothetical protein MTBSS4_10318 [Magnetospirillum sp. SS-4]|nr:hypothetical protein MTBSS4_10318 [Magnetospirillum sp. SS-4]